MAWHTELRPGWSTAMTSRVPETLTISGKDVATRFAAVHVPFLLPGETRTLIPVAFQAYQGDWHSGVDIYKTWRAGWMHKATPPDWVRQPHSWLVFQLNSPEDDLRMPFKGLVKIGEDCARHGIKALHLIGWNNGGQDQGNPSHDPDPRLGTFEDLKAAIAKIQAMGVKVMLFTKFTWADRATEWFRKDLVQLSIKDPYGDYYLHPGYQYQTATQLLDINTKRLIPMCFLSEAYQQVCCNEFQKILDLGASGMLFDEALHHPPALLCFDSDHGHRYGAPVYANDRNLAYQFRRLSEPVNPDFLYAAEGFYDWMWEAYHFMFIRTESTTHIPLPRYMMPEGEIMTTIVGFNERNMINQALMYRYILCYEPYNFKGRLDDFPLTLSYWGANGCPAHRVEGLLLGWRILRHSWGSGYKPWKTPFAFCGVHQSPKRRIWPGDLQL